MSTALAASTVLAYIPSPDRGVWYIGPVPLRAYALCIIACIVVGMIIANRRWRARCGSSESLEMVVVVGQRWQTVHEFQL